MVDTISEIHSQAIELLKYRCYDIILLDYLLKYKNAVQREYSYELLDAIKGDKALQRLAGPFKKFWFSIFLLLEVLFKNAYRKKAIVIMMSFGR